MGVEFHPGQGFWDPTRVRFASGGHSPEEVSSLGGVSSFLILLQERILGGIRIKLSK